MRQISSNAIAQILENLFRSVIQRETQTCKTLDLAFFALNHADQNLKIKGDESICQTLFTMEQTSTALEN